MWFSCSKPLSGFITKPSRFLGLGVATSLKPPGSSPGCCYSLWAAPPLNRLHQRLLIQGDCVHASFHHSALTLKTENLSVSVCLLVYTVTAKVLRPWFMELRKCESRAWCCVRSGKGLQHVTASVWFDFTPTLHAALGAENTKWRISIYIWVLL